MNMSCGCASMMLMLEPGQMLPQDHEPLRLNAGALRLDLQEADEDLAEAGVPIGLAFVGDLLVAEAPRDGGSASRGQVLRWWALTPCELQILPAWPSSVWAGLPERLLWQGRRQARDLVCVRTGAVSDRVRHLLLKLSASGASDFALPRLRDMAALMDSAPETVSRVIGCLSRLEVLHDRQAQRASVDRARLSHLKWAAGMTSSSALSRKKQAPLMAPMAPVSAPLSQATVAAGGGQGKSFGLSR